ncbi:hypothetical protein BDU57DRAFT_528537 [Ampelomyces quisqualis]|uniref:Uncharacterized protein n=1 Tax=Ampelomyces quisqualis TaxID=50730 RepID=A0A6A5QRQ0_AMPQU|nr:hypothetical protein BDU57DRAFT_528537 [Ampelomyces quisqualis]
MAHQIIQHVLQNNVFWGLAITTLLGVPQLAEYVKPKTPPACFTEQPCTNTGEMGTIVAQIQPEPIIKNITITEFVGTSTAFDIVTSTVTTHSMSTVTESFTLYAKPSIDTVTSIITVDLVSTVTEPFTVHADPETHTATSIQTSTVTATETVFSDAASRPKFDLSWLEWGLIGLTAAFIAGALVHLFKVTRQPWYISLIEDSNTATQERNVAICERQGLEREIAELKRMNESKEANLLKAYQSERDNLQATIVKQHTRWERFAKTVEELDGIKVKEGWFDHENMLKPVVDTFKQQRKEDSYQKHWAKARELNEKLTVANERIEYLQRRDNALGNTIRECGEDVDVGIRNEMYRLQEKVEADTDEIRSLKAQLRVAKGFTGFSSK